MAGRKKQRRWPGGTRGAPLGLRLFCCPRAGRGKRFEQAKRL